MKHLGDIKNMTASATPCVDCVTFGSPCQDLSVAGMRAGLAGERSGLFMDAVRVIKDMFWNSLGQSPKFAVWENVPGAFSSNKGEDFRAVLEELARVKEPGVSIPRPENGKWAKAGVICGDGWSIAWRTFDAQFWGVPQRRRRIAVVLDLGGQRAAEILFERTGVPGDPDQSIPPWKGIARDPARCAAGYDRVVEWSGECLTPWDVQSRRIYEEQGKWPAIYAGEGGGHGYVMQRDPRAYTLKIRSGCEGGGKGPLVQTEKSATLSTLQEQTLFCLQTPVLCRAHGQAGAETMVDCSPTLSCNHEQPIVFGARGNGDGNVCPTLTGDHNERITDYSAVVVFSQNQRDEVRDLRDVAGALAAEPGIKQQTFIAFSKETYNTGENATCSLGIESGDVAPTMRADTHPSGVAYRGHLRWIVRRLTPTECERLQGFPDGWTDIGEWVDSRGRSRKTADGPRYKAMGNSIALPQWWWLTCKMARYLPEHATLGSLFDGIGGFPLVWETYHGNGTAVWASEIEDFPIAVTKKHFGGGSV